jgi:hypothetical protein
MASAAQCSMEFGIAYAPGWLFEDALADSRVHSLLVEHYGPPAPIHFVYAANRLLPRRARVFMDFIAEAFARDPALNAKIDAIRGDRQESLDPMIDVRPATDMLGWTANSLSIQKGSNFAP